ncbi:hypothetical protein K438DRAFT_1960299 [Mycena galopus ATCC 62051]|nr:hypothetical protein K438DRAFT_1960299 [Mycena galopus ATCC 62051]
MVILCPCICGVILFRGLGGGRRRTCVKRSPRYPRRPPRTPKATRIDIEQVVVAEQPPNCLLLKVPLEVRQCIYEEALGGRVVHVQLVGPDKVRSTCYQPVDFPSVNPQTLDERADSILTQLLCACRQVYFEAQPILLQRNTLYFSVRELEMAFLEGIEMHCLPDIRSVYLHHSYRTRTFVPPWPAVFPLLQQMRLTRLVFHFELDRWNSGNNSSCFGSYIDILEKTWVPGVLSIRNLHQFGLFFDEDGDAPENSPCRANIANQLSELMVGTRADEKYGKFLEKWNAKRS